MVAILIALRINNWNRRTDRVQGIADYAHALTRGLQHDIDIVEVTTVELDVLIQKVDTLANHVAEIRQVADDAGKFIAALKKEYSDQCRC